MRHGDLDRRGVGDPTRRDPARRAAGRAAQLTPATSASEEELIRLAQHGDARAFGELVERHRARVEAVAWRLTRDASAAHELTHDVFVRMHRSLATFRRDATLATWLYRMVVNVCHDHERRIVRDRSIPLEMAHALPSPADTPDITTEAAERARVIDRMVQSLPETMRDAVVLRYAGGLAYDEIAATLGIAPGTVASRIHRALRIIGLTLESQGIREDSL